MKSIRKDFAVTYKDENKVTSFNNKKGEVTLTTSDVTGINNLIITGATTLNTVNITGQAVIDGINFPTIDGTDGQALTTNGSGTLNFSSLSVGNNPVTLNLNNSNSTINLSSYKTTSFRIKNPAQISLSNGINGVWYTLVIVSNGTYSFTSEIRFPLNNAQPVPSSETIDMYSLHCIDTVSGTRYLATFAYDYTGVTLP